MAKTKLIASSGTLDGIVTMINRFWFSTNYTVNPETLAIEHPDKTTAGFEAVSACYSVRLKAGRYRFESIIHVPMVTPLR